MAGHARGNLGTEAAHGLDKKMLNMPPDILNFIECALNALANRVQPSVKLRIILLRLVDPFGSPDAITMPIFLVELPFFANKALVAKDISVPDEIKHFFGGGSFIGVGWH